MSKPVLRRGAKKLIREYFDFLLKRPKKLDMSMWVFYDPDVRRKRGEPKGFCGTGGCFAGGIAIFAGCPPKETIYLSELPDALRKLVKDYSGNDPIIKVGIQEVAQALLGINRIAAQELFHVGNWPLEYSSEYYGALTKLDEARALQSRINHFLETGK